MTVPSMGMNPSYEAKRGAAAKTDCLRLKRKPPRSERLGTVLSRVGVVAVDVAGAAAVAGRGA
jgi:hypothetical protein